MEKEEKENSIDKELAKLANLILEDLVSPLTKKGNKAQGLNPKVLKDGINKITTIIGDKSKKRLIKLFNKVFIERLKTLQSINFRPLYEELVSPQTLTLSFETNKMGLPVKFSLSGDKKDLETIKKYEIGVGKPQTNNKGELVEIIPTPIWLRFTKDIQDGKLKY